MSLYRVCSLFRINYADVSLTPRLVASLIAPDSIEFYTIAVGSGPFKNKKEKNNIYIYVFLRQNVEAIVELITK